MTVLLSRSIIRVAGADAAAFLQGLITQDIDTMAVGEARFSALLTPQGKILFDFFLIATGGGFLIDCPSISAEALAKRLTLYRLRAKVSIDIDAKLGVAIGDAANALARFADPRLDTLPHRSIIESEGVDEGDEDYERVRLALGVPEFGKDFLGDEVFLLDVNYDTLNAVSYKKGCFVGQEVTSRMKRKGEIRKRTLLATFDGEAPAKGEKIAAGGVAIGEVMSSGKGRAFALVRIDRLAEAESAGSVIEAAGAPLQLAFPPYLKTD
ncbi:MAG: hypothetical protein R3C60_13405 [Parvularculaceae bacterium]